MFLKLIKGQDLGITFIIKQIYIYNRNYVWQFLKVTYIQIQRFRINNPKFDGIQFYF